MPGEVEDSALDQAAVDPHLRAAVDPHLRAALDPHHRGAALGGHVDITLTTTE